jgi:hypothetical protein
MTAGKIQSVFNAKASGTYRNSSLLRGQYLRTYKSTSQINDSFPPLALGMPRSSVWQADWRSGVVEVELSASSREELSTLTFCSI